VPELSWSEVDHYAKASFEQGATEAGTAFLGPVGGAAAGALAGPVYEGIKDVGAAVLSLFTREAPPPILIHVSAAEASRVATLHEQAQARGERARQLFAELDSQWLVSTQALLNLRANLGLPRLAIMADLATLLRRAGVPLNVSNHAITRQGGWRTVGGWTPFADEWIPATNATDLWTLYGGLTSNEAADREAVLSRVNAFFVALETARNRVALQFFRDKAVQDGRALATLAGASPTAAQQFGFLGSRQIADLRLLRSQLDALVANVNLIRLAAYTAHPGLDVSARFAGEYLRGNADAKRTLELLKARPGVRTPHGIGVYLGSLRST